MDKEKASFSLWWLGKIYLDVLSKMSILGMKFIFSLSVNPSLAASFMAPLHISNSIVWGHNPVASYKKECTCYRHIAAHRCVYNIMIIKYLKVFYLRLVSR